MSELALWTGRKGTHLVVIEIPNMFSMKRKGRSTVLVCSCFPSLSLPVPVHCCRKACLCFIFVFCLLSIHFFQGSSVLGEYFLLDLFDTGRGNGPAFRFMIPS